MGKRQGQLRSWRNGFSIVGGYLLVGAAFAADDTQGDGRADSDREAPSVVIVTGTRTEGYKVDSSSTATRTNTALRDVPQSITVVSGQQMKDQLMASIGAVVQYVPGTQVNCSNPLGLVDCLLNDIVKLGGTLLAPLPLVNGVVALLDGPGILNLSSNPNVVYISSDRALHPTLSNAAPAVNAFAAIPSGASALPALKPYQPTQSKPVPTMQSTMLCGAMISFLNPSRCPRRTHSTSADQPELM